MTKQVQEVSETYYAIRIWPYSRPYLYVDREPTPKLFVTRKAAQDFIRETCKTAEKFKASRPTAVKFQINPRRKETRHAQQNPAQANQRLADATEHDLRGTADAMGQSLSRLGR